MTPNKIIQFRGSYNFLSNFYICKVMYEGLEYISSENAFQAAKTYQSERFHFANVSPRVAKHMGRHVSLRPDWEDVKIDIMHEILLSKFSDPFLKAKLLATGDAELVEGNNWGDTFWGLDFKKGYGQNNLGKLLMRVREEIK